MEDTTIYRIAVLPGCIKVSLVGIGSLIDTGENAIGLGWYDSVDSLPVWAQERLALLMLDKTPAGENLPGIGRKLDKSIYWIFS